MKNLPLSATAILLLAFTSVPVSGQRAQNISERSYRSARRILDRGLQALGGIEAFRKVDDISLKSTARWSEIGQSANPDAPYDVRQEELTRIFDLRGGRSYRDQKTEFRGGSPYWGRQILKDKDSFLLDVNSNVAYPVNTFAVGGSIRSAQRRIPHLLLQMALNRAGTLRSLGSFRLGGELHHVITFADGNGAQIALYFDARSNLLNKYETLGDDPILGDALGETSFADYRDIGGVKIPFRVIFKYAGELIFDQTYSEVRINTRPSDKLFAMPLDVKQGPEILGPTSVSLRRLADDVYFVNGINSGDVWFYSQMFVVFKDYVLVVEAPLNNDISKAVVAKIESVSAGKPIRYLIPTHYHTDHIGGVREYIAKGATVVTTPGNQTFIEQIIGKEHSIRPDSLPLNHREPAIEVFRDRRVFKDQQHEVELYNIGPSPHVDEIVVVYLPREKILFVSDLMMTRMVEPFTPPTVTEKDFVEKLRRLNLNVETIANGHGWVGTMEEFLRVLEDQRGRKGVCP
ncbi:MAG TPA: MBL fold metallo-hydrolase [Pyrinomonadaceae bacterium]|nr:MBL fold metallo-hydrolase [Pyrinomonadaceae bacterium]